MAAGLLEERIGKGEASVWGVREEALRERAAERAALADTQVHTGGISAKENDRGEALAALVTHGLKSKRAIIVAERITDREEAEWIALMIEDAARAGVRGLA